MWQLGWKEASSICMVMKHSFKKLSKTIKEAKEMLCERLADRFLLD